MRDELGRERLRRRDADFGAGAREIRERRLAHHRARGNVADRERMRVAKRLRVLQCGEGVGRLARLRDDDDECVRVRHAVAIAVFARDFHVARNACERFDPLLRHQRRIVAGAAREHEHAVDLPEDLLRVGSEHVGVDDAEALERVGDRARLLEDLLLHEMAVRSELDGIARGFDVDDRPLDRIAVHVVDRIGLAAHVGDVALFEVDDATRDRQQRRRIGREKVIAVAQADHQRASCPRADHAAGLARRDHGDRVGAVEFGDR